MLEICKFVAICYGHKRKVVYSPIYLSIYIYIYISLPIYIIILMCEHSYLSKSTIYYTASWKESISWEYAALWSMLLAPTTEGWSKSMLHATFFFLVLFLLKFKRIFLSFFLQCCISFCHEERVLVSHLYPTLCDPMDCSPPGSSVRGILQTRILEWVSTSFSRGSSQPRDLTRIP